MHTFLRNVKFQFKDIESLKSTNLEPEKNEYEDGYLIYLLKNSITI